MYEVSYINNRQKTVIDERSEGHFFDRKSKRIKPASLAKHVSAFANSDGGEIAIGIEDDGTWVGFSDIEAANSHIAYLEASFAKYGCLKVNFLELQGVTGKVLWLEVQKSQEIVRTPSEDVYLRRGAQSIKQDTAEKVRRIELDKGIFKYENTKTQATEDEIENTETILDFIMDMVPNSEPREWIRKQKLSLNGRATVAGVMLFSDEPQIELPKTAVKIYRYKTKEAEGTRETLDFDPIAVEGCAYRMAYESVGVVKQITEKIPIVGAAGLEKISYPEVALHEVITNSIIHRDYSHDDDVHVRIFDDRIEVESPGKLPGHITPQNILKERFARNPRIVRLLNKFRNPPNKDVGEGFEPPRVCRRLLMYSNRSHYEQYEEQIFS